MIHWTILLAVEEAASENGLFDFDATLPLMAVQFLILVAILNAVFYKPLGRAIDERDDYVRNNQQEARERLAKAEQLAQQYEQELAQTRRQAQATIAEAQAEAKKAADRKIGEAQREAQQSREQAQQEIDRQKQEALHSLEGQVETLARQIEEKLVGSQLVKG